MGYFSLRKERTWGCSSVVEGLLSMCKTLIQSPALEVKQHTQEKEVLSHSTPGGTQDLVTTVLHDWRVSCVWWWLDFYWKRGRSCLLGVPCLVYDSRYWPFKPFLPFLF
jgi:hypothetical protein